MGLSETGGYIVQVECSAGHRGEQTPRRFYLDGRAIEASEVLDAWLAPDHRYFKLSDRDGGVYILRHDAAADRWELTLFESTPTGTAPLS